MILLTSVLSTASESEVRKLTEALTTMRFFSYLISCEPAIATELPGLTRKYFLGRFSEVKYFS
jgi:hypothetical protein